MMHICELHTNRQTFTAKGLCHTTVYHVKFSVQEERGHHIKAGTYSNKCCKAPYLLDKLQKGDAGALLLWLVGAVHIKEDVDAHLQQVSECFGDNLLHKP